MRLLAVSMLLILTEVSASACPIGTACVASETRSGSSKERESSRVELAREDVPRRVHAGTVLGHALARVDVRGTRDPLARSLRTHVTPPQGQIQVPVFWESLRRRVYAKLPSYEHRGGQPADRFSLTLSPVVVDSPSDTVPGLGVEGAF